MTASVSLDSENSFDLSTKRALEKLRRDLGKNIVAALQDPLTIEIMLNPDGRIWHEKHGLKCESIGSLSPAAGESVIKSVASFYGKVATKEHPYVEEVLPLDGSRFAGQLPPIVCNPTFSIRKPSSYIRPLTDYVEKGVISEMQMSVILELVKDHKNILVCGGTGSGKTTLTNSIIAEMVKNDPNERVVTIEDCAELICKALNYVGYLTTTETGMTGILKLILRMRPDRVHVGEVRGSEALDLLDTWNVGHAGGIATIHANNPYLALRRLKSCVSRNSDSPADIEAYISDVLDVIIHIEKSDNEAGRKVTEITRVTGFDGSGYITENL